MLDCVRVLFISPGFIYCVSQNTSGYGFLVLEAVVITAGTVSLPTAPPLSFVGGVVCVCLFAVGDKHCYFAPCFVSRGGCVCLRVPLVFPCAINVFD